MRRGKEISLKQPTDFIFFDVGLKMLSPYLKKNVCLYYKYLDGLYAGSAGLNLKNVGAQHFEPTFFKFNLDEYLIGSNAVSKIPRKIFIITLEIQIAACLLQLTF